MKVMTILGTRPEIVRLSLIIGKLDRLCQHVLVHTGQNFDPRLSELFFKELGVRTPDYTLGVAGDTFAAQLSAIIAGSERVLTAERPNRLVVLGDTNSGLAALVAKRLAIPVYHLEAGNRCYDDGVPEEVNRRVIDHCSDVLMPYTDRSRANLLREGIEGRRIHVIGNPILEVIEHHEASIRQSDVLARLGLDAGRYFLATMHRAENIDVEPRFRALLEALAVLTDEYDLPVVCSTHPHTRAAMARFGIEPAAYRRLQFHDPFGLFDFVALERNAYCVLSDSGTVQEECALFKVATVTIRDTTERPETIECGSNILSGPDPRSVLRCVRVVLEQRADWTAPAEYLRRNVSDTAVRIVLGHGPSGRPDSPPV